MGNHMQRVLDLGANLLAFLASASLLVKLLRLRLGCASSPHYNSQHIHFDTPFIMSDPSGIPRNKKFDLATA